MRSRETVSVTLNHEVGRRLDRRVRVNDLVAPDVDRLLVELLRGLALRASVYGRPRSEAILRTCFLNGASRSWRVIPCHDQEFSRPRQAQELLTLKGSPVLGSTRSDGPWLNAGQARDVQRNIATGRCELPLPLSVPLRGRSRWQRGRRRVPAPPPFHPDPTPRRRNTPLRAL